MPPVNRDDDNNGPIQRTWGTAFAQLEGTSLEDCVFLAQRTDEFEKDFDEERHETWVGEVKGQKVGALFGGTGKIERISRSPSGAVYAVGEWHGLGRGAFRLTRTTEGWSCLRLDRDDFPARPSGVCAVRDDRVFVWGGLDDLAFVALWDGKRWELDQAPDRATFDVRARGDIVLLGGATTLALWDRGTWKKMESPAASSWGNVRIWSNDQFWASSGSSRCLAEGTRWGWTVRARPQWPVSCPARFGDKLVVAAGQDGLLALEKDQVTPLTPHLRWFDVYERGPSSAGLIGISETAISETSDLNTVRGITDFHVDERLPPGGRRAGSVRG